MIRGGQNVCGGPLRHLKQLGFYSRFSEKPLNVQKSVAGDQYVFERTREKGGGNKCQFSRRCSFPILQKLRQNAYPFFPRKHHFLYLLWTESDPQGDGLWRLGLREIVRFRWVQEGGVFVVRLLALKEEIAECLASFSLPVSTQWEGSCLPARRRALTGTRPSWHPDLRLSASRMVRK